MLAARAELKKAEKVKRFILSRNAFHPDYFPVKELDHIYFPLIKNVRVAGAEVVEAKFNFPRKAKPETVEGLLESKLTWKERESIPKSQEIVGKIMILEVPEELKKKEKTIAEAYLKLNKSIETVVAKDRIHTGDYRLRKVRILAGRRTKETIHQESGIKIKLDLEKTYFSARLANERLRIAGQVKKGEEILVMFSGAAPYPLVLAKHSPARMIYGVEINPLAHQYALENVALNNFNHKIKIFPGDVRKVVPSLESLKGKFDRILMPLPKTGEQFLDVALPKVKRKGIIHLYAFLDEKEVRAEGKRIKEKCLKFKRPVKILKTVKCGQFSPGTFRVCFDLKTLN